MMKVYRFTVDPLFAAGVAILYPIVLVALGKFIMMAGEPPMSGMPKDVVVPNFVARTVAPPGLSAKTKGAPTVAVRLLLLKSHWPKGWAWSFAAIMRLATNTAR